MLIRNNRAQFILLEYPTSEDTCFYSASVSLDVRTAGMLGLVHTWAHFRAFLPIDYKNPHRMKCLVFMQR